MILEPDQARFLEKLQLRLAKVDRLPQLAILGIVSGLLVGVIIVFFRMFIDYTQTAMLPDGLADNYESLTPLTRLLLSVGGGLLVGVLFQYVAKDAKQVGVIHVMERLAYHQGRLPLRNAIWQFIGASITIISGHSVGREGPGIHLGAAGSSLLGQVLKLPNNSIRILVACGVAASIAASFNTPLAGVVFSMEVIMMEYTIAGFTPVILSAVCATTVMRVILGSESVFRVPPLNLDILHELPYVLLMGLVIGMMAALLIHLLQYFSGFATSRPLWQRTTFAGLLIGIFAWGVPEIMSIGYDTVNAVLLGKLGVVLLCSIVVLKLLATAAGIGLGIPGGLIGPTIVIGATAGGVIGSIAELTYPQQVSSHAFYAVIGMGAMMGATLQAPLAALTAMVELTANPNIILPGMLAVIVSGLTSSELFGKQSVFLMLMKARGLDYRSDPVAQSLRKLGVATVMNTDITVVDRPLRVEDAQAILDKQPQWIVIMVDNIPNCLLPAADLALYLEDRQQSEAVEKPIDEAQDEATTINLLDIPAHRKELATIELRATLQEAFDRLFESQAEALCITHRLYGVLKIDGILTRQDIEAHYQYRK
jgi:CIC family chloride channel protein